MSYHQNGYIGSRMYERAAEAYKQGMLPLSKWTKKVLIAALNKKFKEKYDFTRIRKDILITHFLFSPEWHHTGRFYQRTCP